MVVQIYTECGIHQIQCGIHQIHLHIKYTRCIIVMKNICTALGDIPHIVQCAVLSNLHSALFISSVDSPL